MIIYENSDTNRLLLNTYTCFFDGGSRGNPGNGAYGVIIINDKTKQKIYQTAYIGNNVTSIDAEFCGLISCLRWLVNNSAYRATIKGDSEFVIKQMIGKYKPHTDKTKDYYSYAKKLEKQVKGGITYIHIPRNQNSEADLIVNKTLDRCEKL